MWGVLLLLLVSLSFAQSQCECTQYVAALQELNMTLTDLKLHFLAGVVGLASVLGSLAAVITSSALRSKND